MQSIQDFILKNNPFLEKYISDFFVEESKKASKIDPINAEALKNLENYISGGKKIRANLVILGYMMAGGDDINKILPAAFAAELVHNSLVIHDDFIDNDDFRRGKPTIHKIYSQGKTDHFGASMAVIVGDGGIFLANELISNSQFDPENKIAALSLFNRFLTNTVYGELMDIAFDYKKDITWDDIKRIRIYKTAHYTFLEPLLLGLTLGGFSENVFVKGYCELVGLAFQLQDDILGVFGDVKKTGKSNDSDIREGKKTLLYFKALEFANKKDSSYLLKWYGSKDLDNQKIEEIRRIIKDSGSLSFCKLESKKFVKSAKKNAKGITSDKKYQFILESLADYVIERDK